MQAVDRDVFNYLSARMDLKTGVIGGEFCRVSYGGVALDLSERVGQGRRADAVRVVSSKQVQNAVGRLVDVGLLVRLSQAGKGQFLEVARVFWRSVFGLDRSEQNKVGRMLGGELAGFDVIFSLINNGLGVNAGFSREGLSGEVGRTNTYIPTYQDDVDRFAMSLDWKPTALDVEKGLAVAGYPVDAVKAVWVFEFVSYWSGQDRVMSQGEWTARFCRDMVDLLANPGLFERRRRIKTDGRGTVGKSAVAASGAVGYGWQVVPRDDSRLMAFIRQWGFSDPPPGADFQKCRERLAREIAARLREINSNGGLV
jgi:hypothetical protein